MRQEPPWEDAPTSNLPVSQDQVRALQQQINALKISIGQMAQKLAALGEVPVARQAQAPAAAEPGTLGRGRYGKKTPQWVVDNDPWYVAYLHREGFIKNWPFTDEQVASALEFAKSNPEPGR